MRAVCPKTVDRSTAAPNPVATLILRNKNKTVNDVVVLVASLFHNKLGAETCALHSPR